VERRDHGREQRRHQRHHRDQRVEGRTNGVFERIADGIAHHPSLVSVGARATDLSSYDLARPRQPHLLVHAKLDDSTLPELLFYWMRPNDDDNYVNTEQNKALAVELAMQAGKEIPRSQEQA